VSDPACPLCAGPTLLKRWGEIGGFSCRHCDGHFIRAQPLQEFLADRFQPQAFRRLLEKAGESRPSVRPLTCPDCRTRSYRTANVATLALDICATCGGLYFDRGEADAWFAHLSAKRQPVADAVNNVDAGVEAADIISDLLSFWS
jgi:Zn-finger nucleic acid-binding protein